MPPADLPDLSQDQLVELGGWSVMREGRGLYRGGSVVSWSWDAPMLKGRVRDAGKEQATSLNLRSMTFVENRCSCPQGRRGQICSHAIALCFAARESATPAPTTEVQKEDQPEAAHPEPEESPPAFTWLKLSDAGESLRFRLILPPNFQAAAERDAIMVKVELIVGKSPVSPEQVYRGKAYRVPENDQLVGALLETWCGGRIFGILQLKGEQLRFIVNAWGNEALLYEGSDAQAPVPADQIESRILQYLKIPETVPKQNNSSPQPEVKRSSGISKSSQVRKNITRAPSKPDKVSLDSWLVVDGSPHFLSIRIRDREHPLYRSIVSLMKLNDFRAEPSNGKWWIRDQHKVLNFLACEGKKLRETYDPEYTENYLQRMSVIKPLELRCETQPSGDQFEVTVAFSGKGLDERDIRSAVASGRYYIKTESNIFLIDPEMLQKAQDAAEAISGQKDRIFTPVFTRKIRSAQLADTEAVLEDIDESLVLPEEWKKRSAALRNVGKLEQAPLSEFLDSILRGYQKIGTAWLWHLARNRLGGILADEMGLGKTIQAIGLVESVLNSELREGPALIVAPASLLRNWERELDKFSPDLRVFINHRSQRIENPEELDSLDVVLTSYATLRRDLDLFLSTEFSLIIADEAQHVKNRNTKASRALRRLNAPTRFVLTGTPVENSIDDLRALFDFCLPGFLEKPPPGARGEEKQWYDKRILDRAATYILRRNKREVAPELPDKIEQVIWCDFDRKQQDLYNRVRQKSETNLMNMEAGGASENKLRFAALTELLRLRQVCADPCMLEESFPVEESCKLQAFSEILEEALDGNHRILVFSQFVKLLKRLRDWLESQGHESCYIDGQTRDRLAVCDKFNNSPEIPVCLISLKAGGTGLNLTGADTVVHFDPWWNPAVEDQATDRAHRIGQTRTVTSYKLISVGTVEDKVIELQREKSALMRELLDESEARTAKVNLDTLKSLIGGDIVNAG